MEEKEQEEDNDVVNITAVQLFCISDKAFLGKDMEKKKQKKEEEKGEGL